MPTLAIKEINLQLKTIPDWSKRRQTIRRTYKFGGFLKSIDFVNRVLSKNSIIGQAKSLDFDGAAYAAKYRAVAQWTNPAIMARGNALVGRITVQERSHGLYIQVLLIASNSVAVNSPIRTDSRRRLYGTTSRGYAKPIRTRAKPTFYNSSAGWPMEEMLAETN